MLAGRIQLPPVNADYVSVSAPSTATKAGLQIVDQTRDWLTHEETVDGFLQLAHLLNAIRFDESSRGEVVSHLAVWTRGSTRELSAER